MLSKNYIHKISIDVDAIPLNEYYTSLPFFSYFKEKRQLTLASPVTFFIGENGTGKSTLLEAISVCYGLNAEGGSHNFLCNTKETHSTLHQYVNLAKSAIRPRDKYFLRAESFYNIATEIDRLQEIPVHGPSPSMLDSYGGKSMHEQSHGESFLALMLERFFGNGIYILDEPEASLSPMKQLALIARISELVKLNSQFIICTHSPILSAFPGAEIYEFSDSIRKTAYKESTNYTVTKNFLNNIEKSVDILLSD